MIFFAVIQNINFSLFATRHTVEAHVCTLVNVIFYTNVLGYSSEVESEIKNFKFKMADSIW